HPNATEPLLFDILKKTNDPQVLGALADAREDISSEKLLRAIIKKSNEAYVLQAVINNPNTTDSLLFDIVPLINCKEILELLVWHEKTPKSILTKIKNHGLVANIEWCCD
ncbi:hypothetical protein, partial [Commensalibacter nepenthis]